jgi:hypothetical protein
MKSTANEFMGAEKYLTVPFISMPFEHGERNHVHDVGLK